MRFVRRELRRGDVFVDVGANIGLHSLYVARRLRRLGGGLVIAFEPAADCVARLRAAARRNGLAGLVEIGEVALGNESGEVELRADPR
jgi:FkbM family methyltransferase